MNCDECGESVPDNLRLCPDCAIPKHSKASSSLAPMSFLGCVLEQDEYPGQGWISLNVHWWDSCVLVGAVEGNTGGSKDVWAKGHDFADAVANAIRRVEKQGHRVDVVSINV